MIKLQLLKNNKVIVSDNTLKVIKNNNNLLFEIQTGNVKIVETNNGVEILITEKSEKLKESVKIYEIKLVNIQSGRLRAIRAIKESLDLYLDEAKALCQNDSSIICSTKSKEKAMDVLTKLKENLKETNIKIILNKYEEKQ